MSRRWLIMWFALSFVVVASGCRRVYTFAPVDGTITKRGQPLAGVQVIFFTDPEMGTEGPRSVGWTDEAGRYRLQTDRGDDGAVVGKHRVCILESLPLAEQRPLAARRRGKAASSKLQELPSRKGDQVPTEPKVPAIYGQIHETPLRADVRHGGIQTFDFNIP